MEHEAIKILETQGKESAIKYVKELQKNAKTDEDYEKVRNAMCDINLRLIPNNLTKAQYHQAFNKLWNIKDERYPTTINESPKKITLDEIIEKESKSVFSRTASQIRMEAALENPLMKIDDPR